MHLKYCISKRLKPLPTYARRADFSLFVFGLYFRRKFLEHIQIRCDFFTNALQKSGEFRGVILVAHTDITVDLSFTIFEGEEILLLYRLNDILRITSNYEARASRLCIQIHKADRSHHV